MTSIWPDGFCSREMKYLIGGKKKYYLGQHDSTNYLLINYLAGLLARSQYPEGPATGHLDTGFSWFLCVYK
jgi:hypothetical protein